MRNRVIIGILLVCVGTLFAWRALGHRTPKGQAPLTVLTPGNVRGFESDFNESPAEIRAIVLLSPT